MSGLSQRFALSVGCAASHVRAEGSSEAATVHVLEQLRFPILGVGSERAPECPMALSRSLAAARCLGSGTPAGDPSRLRRISPRSTAFRYRGPEVQAWRKVLTSAGLNSDPISSHSLGPIAIASGTGGYLKTRGNALKSRREIVFNLPWPRAALSSRWARIGCGLCRAVGGLYEVANLAAERFSPSVQVRILLPPK